MLTVNELFSGIGSQSAALKRLGIDFKVIGIAEIDKYAIKSYEAIHGPVRNYGDISKIEKLDYADFWTYSFPYQDISVAGKQAGINENTRSGLLHQVERLLQVSKNHDELPKYLMLENVKNLIGKKFKAQFDEWIQRLDELGYNTYWQVLNAKNYGVPQNRERVFAISIRKDIDTGYAFPKPFDNGKRLKDILQKEVDEKFYLSDEKVELFLKQGNVNPSGKGMNGNVCANEISNTLTTNKGEGPKILQVGKINSSQDGVILDPEGICKTHTAGHNNCPKIIESLSNKDISNTIRTGGRSSLDGKHTWDLVLEPMIAASRGRNPENTSDRTVGSPTEQRLEINRNGTSNTITTVQKDNYVIEPNDIIKEFDIPKEILNDNERQRRVYNPIGISPTVLARTDSNKITTDFRIRKLTPLECWRLMGFTDEQFYKAEKVNSNSQLYKQAGNSIVVDVLYYLFKNLFIDRPTEKKIEMESEIPFQMNILEFIGG